MRYLLSVFLLFLVPLAGCINSTQHQASLSLDQQLETIDIPPIEGLIEEITIPETEATVNEEIKELEHLGRWEQGSPEAIGSQKVTYDFPVTINKQVEFYLDFSRTGSAPPSLNGWNAQAATCP